jgi:hypothetical protein
MARTTLDLDPSVIRQLRRRGRQEHKSMGQVASELLARSMARQDSEPPRQPVTWSTGNLGTPRVDLEDKEALRAALEERI